MDKKTLLSQHFPDFMEQWKKYRKLLNKVNSWVIASDYCLDDKNKFNDVMTFSIFPQYLAPILKDGIKKRLPKDIKDISYISDFAIEFFKEFPYIFSVSIIIKDKNNIFQLNESKFALDKTIQTMKTWPKEKQKEFSQIKQMRNYLNRSDLPMNILSNICVSCHLVSMLVEFLMIKENAKEIFWLSDRDSITTFQKGIAIELARIGYTSLVHKRVPDNKVFGAIKGDEYNKELCDDFIRIPDYISGTIASIDFLDENKASEKHYTLFNQSIVENKRIFLMEVYKNKLSSLNISRNL